MVENRDSTLKWKIGEGEVERKNKSEIGPCSQHIVLEKMILKEGKKETYLKHVKGTRFIYY